MCTARCHAPVAWTCFRGREFPDNTGLAPPFAVKNEASGSKYVSKSSPRFCPRCAGAESILRKTRCLAHAGRFSRSSAGGRITRLATRVKAGAKPEAQPRYAVASTNNFCIAPAESGQAPARMSNLKFIVGRRRLAAAQRRPCIAGSRGLGIEMADPGHPSRPVRVTRARPGLPPARRRRRPAAGRGAGCGSGRARAATS
jgi:hypothetical protein